ncbi:unnamed protein product [Clavelina lepadiformis]|uniref:NXPE C-terminal domain-containing protein n=1 Tax=Clavelina lepadiformis TaxID=159417 RepID=A0ABP0GZI0_CLALP
MLQNCLKLFMQKKQLFAVVVAACVYVVLFASTYLNQSLENNNFVKQNYPLKLLSANVIPPSESLDPFSAYYGLVYKDKYGQPSRMAGIYKSEKCNFNWKQYFPLIISSIQKYKIKNTARNPEAFTWNTSTVTLGTNVKEFKVGDTLVAHLQAKNRSNRNKTFGGDYFRARLIRKTPDGALTDGIACDIKDHLNGSYTLQVPLLMAGTFTLEVKLVLSLEGIAGLIDFTSMQNHKGHNYLATLQTKEIVECNVDLNIYNGYEDKLMCDYGNPRNGETWFCNLPPSGKCSPITWMINNYELNKPPYNEKLQFPKRYGTLAEIIGSGIQVNVFNGMEHNESSTFHASSPSVYLHQGNWIRTLDSKIIESKQDFRMCLDRKEVYMFGDSTIRQFFYNFANRFSLNVYGPDNSIVWQQPKTARSKDGNSNITLYYRAHGPPLRNPGPPSSRPYISDSIDGIRVAKRGQVYVFFNIGTHLIDYETSLYVRRLLGIKEAIVRHHKSFPNTKFIVRGMNVVESIEEWLILRYETLLRETFKNMSNVFYLNLWDFTTVMPLDDYHPKSFVLEKQVLLLFNLICEI